MTPQTQAPAFAQDAELEAAQLEAITAGAGLAKVGTGTLILNSGASNAYAGATTVREGVLL